MQWYCPALVLVLCFGFFLVSPELSLEFYWLLYSVKELFSGVCACYCCFSDDFQYFVWLTEIVQCCKEVSALPVVVAFFASLQLRFFVPSSASKSRFVCIFASIVQVCFLEGKNEKSIVLISASLLSC